MGLDSNGGMRGWEIGSFVVGLDNNGGEDGRLGA